MLKDVDWPWVRAWAGRTFVALLALGTFGYLTASPILRPGGAMQTLPAALAFGAAAAVVGTAVVCGVLAFLSARRRGQ
ncbi:MAG: hypothetical protein H6842_12745 [Rhodospirillaceae bacterium]|nr:hypothetical protein [Rhodospirillaceae bacterium]